jgi:hypothetical protein
MSTNIFNSTKRFILTGLAAVLVALLIVTPAVAQDEYRVTLRRNIGFASGSQMRGDFTISLSGPEENIVSVTFLLDGQEMTTVSAAPFRYRFNTDRYPDGVHDLSARITFTDGATRDTGTRRFEFVSSEAQSSTMVKIILPILGISLLLTLLGGGSQIFSRGKSTDRVTPGTERKYGAWGGSICSKCKRPTPLHFGGINLLGGKLDRCENCGKWSMMRRYPLDQLRAAEQAELASEKATVGQAEKSEEEKLREMLDKSKYAE